MKSTRWSCMATPRKGRPAMRVGRAPTCWARAVRCWTSVLLSEGAKRTHPTEIPRYTNRAAMMPPRPTILNLMSVADNTRLILMGEDGDCGMDLRPWVVIELYIVKGRVGE